MIEARALLLTDIVGSTQLNDRLGDAAMAPVWQAHDRAARELLRTWRGREVGRSDGFLLLFDDSADAAGFALAYHRRLRSLAVPLAARVGVHFGPVSLRENSIADRALGATPFEIDGVALPIAARVTATAAGGQTLLTAAAAQALGGTGWKLQSHGHWRLKGVAEPLELFELGDEHAPFTPPADTDKAYRLAWVDGAWLPARTLPHRLPAERDAFVGRGEALQSLVRHFDAGVRLLTLLGTGGIGKTRLALRYARGWLGNHPGGAWFCDLSPARSANGVLHAVARGLDVPLGSGDALQQLGAAIAGRGPCLVILDNFEQVARHAEALLGRWLELAPQARFIATSREVLDIAGEQVLVLPPLPADDACRLFDSRMRAAGGEPGAGDEAAIASLVELLDRLPLAIELAAARTREIPPHGLLQRMGQRFELLARSGGRQDRQATLRATLDWSWDLLGRAEQGALAQLSAFERGFTLEAAQAVVELPADDASTAVEALLQALVEKSLLRRQPDGRFQMLRTVQDYAAQQLAGAMSQRPADGAAQGAVQRRHWRFFATLDELSATSRRCDELENLVTACRRAATAGEGEPAVAMLVVAAAVLLLVGPVAAIPGLAAAVAAVPGLGPGQRAQIARVVGVAHFVGGRHADALAAYEEGIALARTAGDEAVQVRLRCAIGDALMRSGEVAAAAEHLNAALAGSRALGDRSLEYRALNALGTFALQQRRLDDARRLLTDALAIARALGHRRWEGGLLGNLGVVALSAGRHDEAMPYFRQSLEVCHETGDRQWAANAQCNIGLLHHEAGREDEAEREFIATLHTVREIGQRSTESTVLCNLGLVHVARGRLEEATGHFGAAAEIAVALRDLPLAAECHRHLGRALRDQGFTARARTALQTALALAHEAQVADEAALATADLEALGSSGPGQ